MRRVGELYARAGERVYGTRTVARGNPPVARVEDYHHATVRQDLYLGELPDFPACLGDWQQVAPPIGRHFQTEVVNVVTTKGTETTTGTATKTTTIALPQHGGGKAPQFGVVWSGESWWRPYEHAAGGNRASLHYDLRFRGTNGTCTWGMERIGGTKNG